jgi:multidrug efflux pump subunit AcrB
MQNPFARRPWLLVVLAFVLLLAGWAVLFKLASENRPEAIPVPPPQAPSP